MTKGFGLWASVLSAFALLWSTSGAIAATVLQQIGEFAIPEANQGVGVDDRYFYVLLDKFEAMSTL